MSNIETDAVYAGPVVHKTSRFNPTKVLLELRTRYPKADKPKLLALFRARMLEAVRQDEDCLHPLSDAYFYREWANLEGYERRRDRRNSSNEPSPRSPNEREKEKEQIKDRIRLAVLLDTVLPDGRAAREHTFAAIKQFGGFWRHLATKGKPNQKVGDVLGDDEVQTLWLAWIKSK
jgi:hypothetical protein